MLYYATSMKSTPSIPRSSNVVFSFLIPFSGQAHICTIQELQEHIEM